MAFSVAFTSSSVVKQCFRLLGQTLGDLGEHLSEPGETRLLVLTRRRDSWRTPQPASAQAADPLLAPTTTTCCPPGVFCEMSVSTSTSTPPADLNELAEHRVRHLPRVVDDDVERVGQRRARCPGLTELHGVAEGQTTRRRPLDEQAATGSSTDPAVPLSTS